MNTLDGIYDEIVDRIATPRLRLILLEILKKEGKPERAIKACMKVLESFPDDIDIRGILAETYLEQGSIEFAEPELEKLCKQIDELSSVFKLRAELLRRENRIEEAIDSLKIYLAHHRSDQEATRLLSELSSPKEEEPSVLPTSTLAEIYYKQGELEEAIKVYEQVVEASPDDEKSRIRLNELKEMKEAEERRKAKEGILKEKKLRLIGILERWLAAIEQRRLEIVN
ncbi:MAG: tetratricopeptide repeat protein [Desulfobacterales bacterium]|nr:tetratricopeptide repeat protein [Desulfobacterales bacterium]